MSGKEFIESGKNSSDLATARRQQRQINLFTISKVQEDVNVEQLKQWADKKYIGEDHFLNWVKTIFKQENFKSFYKYLRYPLPSTTLIREKIVPELERVFHADDSFCSYMIGGQSTKSVENLNSAEFSEKVFHALMYNHNSLIVTKLNEEGELEKEFISVNHIEAIYTEENEIKKVAYRGEMENEFGEMLDGFIYVDDEVFEFYEKKEGENNRGWVLSETPTFVFEHEQECCPVVFASPQPFYEVEKFAVRQSVFSDVRTDLEEYVFLKTLQRMTDPNGAIPIVTKLQTNEVKEDGQSLDSENTKDGLPLNAEILKGSQSKYQNEVANEGGPTQAGTVYEIPAMKDDNNRLDMDAVQNFIKFFYTPVEALDYLNRRVKEVENYIITKVVGDYSEANEAAKNEKQVSKSFVSKQDKLRMLSKWISRVVSKVETISLGYLYGEGNYAEIFLGSDFFIESKMEIYDMIGKAPNPIERRNLLKRLSGVNNKGNKSSALRDKILYSLLPYATDSDFDKAINRGNLTDELFNYQTRFNYWVSMFESKYGSIVSYWEDLGDIKDDEKILAIDNLMMDLVITQITNTNNNE